jgi:hypothetical protein
VHSFRAKKHSTLEALYPKIIGCGKILEIPYIRRSGYKEMTCIVENANPGSLLVIKVLNDVVLLHG